MKTLSKKEFIELYSKLSTKDMAEQCEVTRMCIRRWARKFGLPPKHIPSLIVEPKDKK